MEDIMTAHKITLADTAHCTGCGACKNICHKQAISLIPDKEGFIQPVINESLCVSCRICETICPVLHPTYKNEAVTSCYAMWGEDELRRKSSTAGMFLLAAQSVLQKGGIVYGAAWTKDWHVHHIGVENEQDLELLTGSKYLQSDTENTYQEAKLHLQKGREVLYSGCPCQIAGLYAYLGNKDYPNLTTIEVLCHGVPSPKAFQKYLTDNFKGQKIRSINLRDKAKFGWSTTTNIYFMDSDPYHKNEREDSFFKAFLPCMILRKSCSSCPFSRLPRQADISLGDFWGIDAQDKSWNDRKGTELILINNNKGRTLVNNLKQKFKRYQEFPLDAALRVNKTIIHPFRENPGRKHFFSSMELKPFNQLVDDSLNHIYDIGVVGLWYGINYGSVLTYYALYCLLKDLGYDPVMLPKPNTLWEERFNAPDTIAQRFIWRHCNVFNPCRTQDEYPRMNDRCKDFIIGSDVVWNYGICGKDSDQFFFLDWVESGHKKIAYAASFGNGLDGSEEYKIKARYHLQQFDALSIRESFGVKQARKECSREDIVQVLDPVFVCNPAIYQEILSTQLDQSISPFIFAYILNRDMAKQKKELLQLAADFYKAEIKICGNPNEIDKSKECYGNSVLPVLSVEEWLAHMRYCTCYIGDSYHALCFSLIFHKPFLIVYGSTAPGFSGNRFYSLLQLVGLEQRLISNLDDMENCRAIMETEIDWDYVDSVLNNAKDESLAWLKTVLQKERRTPSPEEYIRDSEKRKISEYGVQLYEQSARITNLERILSKSSDSSLFKRGLRCCKDHGLMYTLKYCFSK